SKVLLMMIAQHQIDADNSPSITSLTTMLAFQNMVKTEPSDAAAANGVAISFMNLIPRNVFSAACAVQIGHFCGPARKNAEGRVKTGLRLTAGYEAGVSVSGASFSRISRGRRRALPSDTAAMKTFAV